MQYISPVSLLDNTSLQQLDKKSVALARKKMLAELELNGGQAITINGRELTKNDIINFFEDFQQAKDVDWHIAIANDAVLLRFLEHGTMENGQKYSDAPTYTNAAFINWLSPYFFTSFNTYATHCFKQQDFNQWATLLNNPLLMNTGYTEKAWDSIEKMVRINMEQLENFEKSKGFAGRNIIEPLTNVKYLSILKHLPDERFTQLKDDYAYVTMQCAIYVYNRFNKSLGTQMVENALNLAVTIHIQAAIAAKLGEMEALNKKERAKRKSNRYGWAIGLVILIIYMVATFSAPGGGSSYNRYKYQYQLPTIYTPKIDSILMDSISYKLRNLKLPDSLTGPYPILIDTTTSPPPVK